MHGVAEAVGAWLDEGHDPLVVRARLTEGAGSAGRGEALAVGPGCHCVEALLVANCGPVMSVTGDHVGTFLGDTAETMLPVARVHPRRYETQPARSISDPDLSP
jgi:hypothetical protein